MNDMIEQIKKIQGFWCLILGLILGMMGRLDRTALRAGGHGETGRTSMEYS